VSLQVGQPLPNDWQVTSLRVDGSSLLRSAAPEWREAGRKAAVTLVPLVFLVVLRAGLSAPEAPVLWPLVAALVLVCIACVAATARHVRRALGGVRLETNGQHVRGWVDGRGLVGGFFSGAVNELAQQIEVQQFVAQNASTRLRVLVRLPDGREVGGPEWVCEDEALPGQLRLAKLVAEALAAGGIAVAPPTPLPR
jgi:hypothetical protein